MSNSLVTRGASSRDLAKALAAGELSAHELHQVSPQAVYIAIQQAGLDACRGVVPMLSAEQYKAILDFECWRGDRVDEDNFWNLLSTLDEEKSLEPIGQFLDNVDHELLAMIISRYVETQTFEEATDQPPGKYWHSPDQGFTWVHFKTEDPERYRLLGRILAIVFAAQPELFYQLIAMPMSATPSELEESSYQLRLRRLGDIGIPEHEQSAELHSPLSAEAAVERLRELRPEKHVAYQGVVALAEGAERIQPLADMLDQVLQSGGAEAASEILEEITYIINCSVVYFGIAFYEQQLMSLQSARVHGAINIGLERVSELSGANLFDIYSHLGLVRLYRVGLSELFVLRDRAVSMSRKIEKISAQPEPDQAAEAVLGCAREAMPVLPMFFTPQGFLSDEQGKLPGGVKAITSLVEVRAAKELIVNEFAS